MKQLELFSDTSAADEAPAEIQVLAEMSERERAVVLRRHSYVRAIEGLPQGQWGDRHLQAAIEAVGIEAGDPKRPSPRQVRGWESRLREADGNLHGLIGRRAVSFLGSKDRWAPWIGDLADAAAAQFYLRPAPSLTGLVREALAHCYAGVAARGCAPDEVPAFETMRRMIRARLRPPEQALRLKCVSNGHPLSEVMVVQYVVQVAVPELGIDRVHLSTGRDTYSGVTVAAMLGTAQAAGDELLGLFGARTPMAAPEPLGAARLCMGIPDTLLIDPSAGFATSAFRDAAATLGITLQYAADGVPDDRRIHATLQRWLALHGEANMTAEGLMAAVQGWLAAQDHRRSGLDWRSPMDRWQEGVARYPIRLRSEPLVAPAAGDASVRSDSAEAPDTSESEERS